MKPARRPRPESPERPPPLPPARKAALMRFARLLARQALDEEYGPLN